MIVAYQGEPGAFSDEAARRRFDNPDTRGYATFDAVVEALSSGHVDFALLPLENSIVGPIVGALLAALPRMHNSLISHRPKSSKICLDSRFRSIFKLDAVASTPPPHVVDSTAS